MIWCGITHWQSPSHSRTSRASPSGAPSPGSARLKGGPPLCAEDCLCERYQFVRNLHGVAADRGRWHRRWIPVLQRRLNGAGALTAQAGHRGSKVVIEDRVRWGGTPECTQAPAPSLFPLRSLFLTLPDDWEFTLEANSTVEHRSDAKASARMIGRRTAAFILSGRRTLFESSSAIMISDSSPAPAHRLQLSLQMLNHHCQGLN